ncbi:MAG: hypothetical protein M3P43_12410 [Actinomycetota bacterium]|nr:hypothetical protein [Actinomycetota bacterium]
MADAQRPHQSEVPVVLRDLAEPLLGEWFGQRGPPGADDLRAHEGSVGLRRVPFAPVAEVQLTRRVSMGCSSELAR